MEGFTKRKWLSVTLLAVILPMSLLVTFRLTGIMKEPPTPEVIMGGTVSWNITKQQKSVTLDEAVENLYQSDDAFVSVTFVVPIGSYIVHPSQGRYPYKDSIDFGIEASVNASLGFIHSVHVNFSRTDRNSSLLIYRDPDLVETYNLDILRHDLWATPSSEGHVMAKAANQTNHAFLRIWADWVFLSKEANHSITVTLETTVFNGTSYIRIVMPIQLGVNAP